MTSGELLYYGGLALWSAFVAYTLLFSLKKGKPEPAPAPAAAPAPAPTTQYMPAERPVPAGYAPEASAAPVRLTLEKDGFKAFQRGEELTVDDIVTGLARG